MNRIRGRHAQFSFGFTFLFIIAFAIFMLFYSSILTVFVNSRSPLPEFFNNDLAHAQIVNNCFAYKNPIGGETMTNVLDERKLNNTILRDCFKTSSKNYLPVKVTITSEYTNPYILSTMDYGITKKDEHRCLLKLKSTNQTVLCKLRVET
jgi:hypothetical protein